MEPYVKPRKNEVLFPVFFPFPKMISNLWLFMACFYAAQIVLQKHDNFAFFR